MFRLRLNGCSSAAALREGIQQALIAGDAHHAFAAAHPFRRVFQRPVAAAAFDALLGLFLILFDERFNFHAQSFLLRYLDELTPLLSTSMPSNLLFLEKSYMVFNINMLYKFSLYLATGSPY